MGRQWFYRIGDAERGPVSVAELKALAAGGALTPESPVRPDDAAAWTPAGRVKGLFPDAADATEAVTRTAGRVKKVARAAAEVSDAVLHVAEAGDKVGRAASAVAGAFGLGSSVVGSLGDFLRPLGRVNAGVAVAALAAAGVLLALARVRASARLRLAGVAALAVAAGFALWAALGAAGRDDRGFLATHVEPVERLQEKVLPPKEPKAEEPPKKKEPPPPPPPPAVPTRKAEPVVILPPPPPPPRPTPLPVPVTTFGFRGPAALGELTLNDSRHRVRPNGGGLEILKSPDLKTPHGTIRTRADYAGPIEARFEVFALDDACYDVYLGVYNAVYLRWGIYGNTRTVVHVGGRDVEVTHPRIVPNRLYVVTLAVSADRRAEVRIDGVRVLEQAIAPRAELRGPVYLLQGGFGHYVVQELRVTARRAGEQP